jgi:hypothetical protein
MKEELHFHGNQLNQINTVFTVGYTIGQGMSIRVPALQSIIFDWVASALQYCALLYKTPLLLPGMHGTTSQCPYQPYAEPR